MPRALPGGRLRILQKHLGGLETVGAHGDTQLFQGRFVDLRDAALVDAKHASNLLHGPIVIIVQLDHLLVANRQCGDHQVQSQPQLMVSKRLIGALPRGDQAVL